jgi:hypothetical protein
MEEINFEPVEPYRPIRLGLLEPDPSSARPISNLPASYAYQPRRLPLRMTAAGGLYFAFSIYLLIDGPRANFLNVLGAAGFGALFVFGLAIISRKFVGPRQLELREDGILLPAGALGLKMALVPYAEILAVRELAGERKALALMTRSHRTYEVSDNLLPSPEVFEDIRAFLKRRIGYRAA